MAETSPVRRICIFGGTFDPIHIAHLKMANLALQTFALDRVVFVPAANPPHKATETMTPYEDRYHMVEIACAPYPPFEVSRIEAGPEKSYSIETVEHLREQMEAEAELFFLIGADAFDEVTTWHRWQELLPQISFIVVSRPGREYAVPPGARVYRLDGLELPVSSSEIRSRLAQAEDTPEVPAEVREYIDHRGLYGRKGEEQTASTA